MIPSIFKILSVDKRLLWGAMIFLIGSEAMPLAYPILFQRMIDGALNQMTSSLPYWIMLYACVVLLHSLFLYFRIFLGQCMAFKATHGLRLRLFEHLKKIPIQYFQKTPVGNTLTRLGSDTDSCGSFYSDGFLELFSNLALLLFSILVMFSYDARLALMTMVFFPFMVGISAWFRILFRKLQYQYRNELSSLNSFLQESLSGLSIIRVFARQEWILEQFRTINQNYKKISLLYAKRYAGFFPIVQSFSDLSLVACYAGVLIIIKDESLSAGTITAFAWIASIYTRPLREISDRINTLQSAMAAGDRIQEFLEIPVDPSVHAPLVDLDPAAQRSIEFRNVHFAYRKDQPVLKDLSFSISRGSRVALVGMTGCGKSTVLNMLLKFVEPSQGTVFLQGSPIGSIPTSQLFQKIAWLGQDTYLFPGTLKDNIVLGQEFNGDRLQDVCRSAQIFDWIESLPHGMETVVGPHGQDLSMGQRQLVAYARVLYQSPEILLLDEPTASIDSQTEHALNKALEEVLKNRTALIVSHRPATIAACDRILILHQGKIHP